MSSAVCPYSFEHGRKIVSDTQPTMNSVAPIAGTMRGNSEQQMKIVPDSTVVQHFVWNHFLDLEKNCSSRLSPTQGQFTQNCITGKGRYSWPDGSTYEGYVFNGLRHGFGTFTAATGQCSYSGQWQNGKKNGKVNKRTLHSRAKSNFTNKPAVRLGKRNKRCRILWCCCRS